MVCGVGVELLGEAVRQVCGCEERALRQVCVCVWV